MIPVFERIRSGLGFGSAAPVETRDYKLSEMVPADFGIQPTSGVYVTPQTAMQAPAVLCAITKISEGIATFPLSVYRKTKTGREVATDHPLHFILRHRPNVEISDYEWKRQVVVDLLIWGSHLSHAPRTNRGPGYVHSLNPVPWDEITVEREDRTGRLAWVNQLKARRWYRDSVLQVRGLGLSPIEGLARCKVGRDAIGGSIALQKRVSSFYSTGAIPPLDYHVEGRIEDEEKDMVTKDLHRFMRGDSPALVTDSRATVTALKTDSKESEFRGLLDFSTEDIARVFNIPPHLINNLKDATFSNIVEQNREFLTLTLLPILTNIQSAISFYLLTEAEVRAGVYVEFNTANLERMDAKTRAEIWAKAIAAGYMTPDEARARENLNNLPDDLGSKPIVQGAMIPMASLGAPQANGGGEGTREDSRSGENSENSDSESFANFLERDYAGWLEQPTEMRVERINGSGWYESIRSGYADLDSRERRLFLDARLDRLATSEVRSSRTRLKIRKSADGPIRTAAERIGKRFTKNVGQLIDSQFVPNGERAFIDSLEQYFRDQRDGIEREFGPVLRSLGLSIAEEAANQIGKTLPDGVSERLDEYIGSFAEKLSAGKFGQLRKLVEEESDREKVPEVVATRLAEWEEKDGDKLAIREGVRLDGFISGQTWLLLGVVLEVWRTSNPCPFCDQLDGLIAGIEKTFIDSDKGLVAPDGSTMQINRQMTHPPAHGSCECFLTPVVG